MSTKPNSNRAEKEALKCTVCRKTFRNSRILNAHLVHTHQIGASEPQPLTETRPSPRPELKVPCRTRTYPSNPPQKRSIGAAGTTKRKICIYSCPKCPVKFNHFSKIHQHLETVHGRNGGPNVIHQLKCVKCNQMLNPGTPHECQGNVDLVLLEKKAKKHFICGCERNYRSWPFFQSHILRHHKTNVESFFFPDHKYFELWKDDLCRRTGLRYECRRPDTQWKDDTIEVGADPPSGGSQYWHCSHAPPNVTSGWCPSAIVVTTFDKGLMANYYAEHPTFKLSAQNTYRMPSQFKGFSLSAVSDWLDVPLEGGGLREEWESQERLGKQIRGLLKYVLEHLEGLDSKHLRSLYGKSLDMITTINDQTFPMVPPIEANHKTRPINTMVGQCVLQPVKQQQVKLEVDPLGKTKNEASDPETVLEDEADFNKSCKIDRVFSLKQTGTTKTFSRVSPVAKPAVAKPAVAKPAVAKPAVAKPALAEKKPAVKRALTVVDIEDELLNDVVKKKPQNGKTDSSEANETAKTVVTKNSASSYVDTFKDFIEKGQYGHIYTATKSRQKRNPYVPEVKNIDPVKSTSNNCNCVQRPNCTHGFVIEAKSGKIGISPPNKNQHKYLKNSVTVNEVEQAELGDVEVKNEPDIDEITIEENGIGHLDEYEVMEQENDCNILILKI